MGWQGASWRHPAQTRTHANVHTHVPHIFATHTHTQAQTVIASCSSSCSYTDLHESRAAYEVLGEKDGKEEGGNKVCRQNPKCLSVCPSHTGPLHTLHSISSKCEDLEGQDPNTESINVLLCYLFALKTQRSHRGRGEMGDRNEREICFFFRRDNEQHQWHIRRKQRCVQHFPQTSLKQRHDSVGCFVAAKLMDIFKLK